MADSSTDRLGLLKIEEGSHANEWGDLTNVNIGRLDAAIRGFKEIVVTAPQTLDATDITTTGSTAEDESFFHWIEFTGTPGVTTAITVQAEEMGWCVINNTDSIINFTPAGGTLTALAVGKSYTLVYIAADTAFTNIGAVPGDFTGSLVTTEATDSTSGSTGSIQTNGGIGAVKDIVTDATVKPLGDTAAGDAAAIGYTATEGLIITGQGSATDVTIKNDADQTVMGVPTGTQNVNFSGEIQLATVNIMDKVWPVGSIYQSTVSTNPNTLFGVGTWVALEDRFLIGASATYAAASTGGSADAVVIAHDHDRGTMEITGTLVGISGQRGVFQSASGAFSLNNDGSGVVAQGSSGSQESGLTFTASAAWTGNTSEEGVDGTDLNLPPYEAVYMWKRTA